MASLGDLIVRVGAKIDGFEQSMGTVSQRLNAVDRDAAKAFSGFDKMADRLGTVFTAAGAAMTGAITLPLAGLATASTSFAGNFEAALNKIKALGDDVTGPALERLRAQALQLGKDTKFSAQQAADGMALFASAGLSTTDILAVMPGTLALAAAGMFSIEEAAEITKNTLGQFQLQASEAGRVADVFAQVSADTSVSMQGLGTTFGYVGAVAKGAGQTLEETGAAIVALDKAGIQAEKAGTGLRGVLGSLIAPSSEAKREMSALGVAVADQEGRIRPLSDIMEQFRSKLATVGSEAERQRIIFEVFGREAGNAAQVLIQTGGSALDAFEQKLVNSAGAAARMAATMNQGLNYSLEQFKGSVETAGIALGTALLPVVGKMIDLGTRMVNEFLLPAAQWFGKLPEPVQAAAIALAAMAAAAGPVLLVTGQLAGSITAILPAITSLSGALGLTASGAAPLAGALGALGAALPVVAALAAGLATAWALWKFQDDLPGILALKIAFEALATVIGFQIEVVKAFASALGDVLPLMSTWLEILKFILTPQRKMLEGLQALSSAMRGFRVDVDTLPKPVDAAAKALDDMNKKAKPLHEQFGVTISATSELKKEFPRLDAAIREASKAIDEAKTKTQSNKVETNFLTEALKILQGEYDKTKASVDDYKARVLLGRAATVDITAELSKLAAQVGSVDSVIGNVSKIALPSYIGKIDEAKPPTDRLREAMKSLGITGVADLKKVADEALNARDVILGSGIATDFEKKTAVFRALKAQVEAAVQMGKAVTDEQRATLEKMEAELGSGKGQDAVKAASGMFTQVSTVITNFAQESAKALFEGGGSWGEKFTKLWGDLKVAVVSSFIEPATAALTSFLTGIVADLMGGKGFGGILDQIKNLGSSLKNIVPGLSSAASSAGSAASGAGGASIPAGGGAGGAASGLGSTADIITGAISAAANVISAIYNVRIEGTLNQMERNTAAASIHLEALLNKANEFWPWARETHMLIGDVIVGVLRELRDGMKTLFSVNVNLSGADQKALIESLITRVGTFDTLATDRLLDIYARAGEINRTIQDGTKTVSDVITSQLARVSGSLAAIEAKLPSTLENALGGNALGGIAGLAGTLPAAISGLIAGLIRGSGKTEDLIEENTRFTAAGIIGPAGVVDSLRQFLPVQSDLLKFQYDVAAPWMAEMQSYLEGGLTDRIMQVHDVIASNVVDGLSEIRGAMNAQSGEVMKLVSVMSPIRDVLIEMREAIRIQTTEQLRASAQPDLQVNIQGNVIGTREFVDQLTAQVMAAVRLQLVKA